MYFLDPYVREYTDNTETDYYYITVGGGTDLLLSGDYPTGPVLNVDLDKTYNTIQAAIDDPLTLPGHLIEVQPGTYPEQLTITKALTINGADGAILDGATLGTGKTGVSIKSGNVTFNNIDVVNFSGNGMIVGYEASVPGNLQNVHITNCLVSNVQPGNHGFGIYVGYESEGFTNGKLTTHLDYSGLVLANNEITNTNDGAMVLQSITASIGTLQVTDNYLHGGEASGIWIDAARNIDVEGNVIDGNTWGMFISVGAGEGWYNGESGPYGPQNVNIIDNEITNNAVFGIGYYGGWTSTFVIEDNLIDGNPAGKGVTNSVAASLDASPNYWGDTDPSDDITGNVAYDPWWMNLEMTILSSHNVLNVVQQVSYPTIQAAIDAAVQYDVIEVAGGECSEALNFENKSDITLRGTGTRELTILKPEVADMLPWNYFGHTDGRRCAIRIVESDNITLENIVLDCALVKNNGWHGVLYANSTGGSFSSSTFKNMYTDQAHYYDLMIYARALAPYTPASKATLSLYDCDLIDTGRIGYISHDYVHATIELCDFHKTTHTFGYGMEIGSASTADIISNVMYGFDTPAVSDGSVSAAIYVENCYTQAETGVTKEVTIQGNVIHDNQIGITVGNQFNNYAGDVDIVLNITGNDLDDNNDGIVLCDEDKANGSSVTATLTNNTIDTALEVAGSTGLFTYSSGDGDLSVSMTGNSISGYDYGMIVYDFGADPATSLFDLSATAGNSFSNSSTAVYLGNVNWDQLPTISGNSFANNNPEHVNNSDDTPLQLDMDAILADNSYDHSFYVDQVIYANASLLYVDVPDEVASQRLV
ncbi:MAG TPA: right-handed parallel beta-helix repeat-containing protein [Candidatus Syntrophosphaera sp.]|nr:right-handed parallel beta-helix repeat-containing protein [Candidatus Syntrophosphaera sp.]